MSTVIVAEKPSVARDIAGVVGADRKRDGYLENTDGSRIVTRDFQGSESALLRAPQSGRRPVVFVGELARRWLGIRRTLCGLRH